MILFEPGDGVALRVVRAERVLPDDIYWGVELAPGKPRKGFILESEGVPVPKGAEPYLPGKVQIGSFVNIDSDALVLIQDLRSREAVIDAAHVEALAEDEECADCGEALSDPEAHCDHCGGHIEEDACQECGKEVDR